MENSLLASGDPMNVTLAVVWSALLIGALSLTWYSYLRWKWYPQESLSHDIAMYMKQFQMRFLIGITLGMTIGVMVGFVLGMFAGHWFWPVELGG